MFPFCGNSLAIRKSGIQQTLGYRRQIFYREENVTALSSRYLDVSRIGSSAGQDHTVKLFFQFFCGNVFSHIHAGLKFHAFRFHQFNSAIQNLFIQFHIRDTVAEQTADPVMTLENGHAVSSAVQLLCSCQSGRTASHNCHFLSGANFRDLWLYPAHLVCVFDDRALIFLCRYRFSVQITGTGCLAECRADTAGKFRETVCLRESLICLFPVATVYQIIRLRYQIVQRATGSHAS